METWSMVDGGEGVLAEIELTLFGRPYSTLEAELRVDANLGRLIDFVETGFRGPPLEEQGRPIRVRAMARAAGLSKTSLNKSLRQRSGFAPHEFLLRRRVMEAARLILGTEATLIEIANAAGFTNLTGLERTFRRLLGRTPSELREQGQESGIGIRDRGKGN